MSFAEAEFEITLPGTILPLSNFSLHPDGTVKYKPCQSRLSVTPLHLAATYGDTNFVSLLLNYFGIEIDRQPKNGGTTALFLALFCGHRDTARMLLNRGANPSSPSGYNALHAAAARGLKYEIRKFICDFEVNPDIEDIEGATPITYALQLPQKEAQETIFLLFSLGAERESPVGHWPYADLARSMEKEELANWLTAALPSSPGKSGRP
jgi:hypothetical protein